MTGKQVLLSGRSRLAALCALLLLAALAATAGLFPRPALGVEYTVPTVPNVQLGNKLLYLSDPDHLVNPQDAEAINVAAKELRDELGIEVAVVALNSIGDSDPRQFATALFQHWGLGQKGKDNGLLILLVTEPPQRSIVFETGYGLEGVLPDAVCFQLQQKYMVPAFKKGEYSQGLRQGVAAVKKYLLSSDYERSTMVQPQAQSEESQAGPAIFGFLLVLLLLFLFRRNPRLASFLLGAILGSLSGRGRGGPGGFGGGGGSWGGGRSGGGGAGSRF